MKRKISKDITGRRGRASIAEGSAITPETEANATTHHRTDIVSAAREPCAPRKTKRHAGRR